MLGAEGDRAAEVGGGIHVGQIAFEDNFGMGFRELQDDPGKFAILD
jgi:hypothetical protein